MRSRTLAASEGDTELAIASSRRPRARHRQFPADLAAPRSDPDALLLAGGPGHIEPDLTLALGARHQIVTLNGDIRDRETCAAAADCDVVIHGLAHPGVETDRLDAATRGTWNVLTTTRARRVILLSSMRIFDRYDPGWHIDETWSPRPTAATDELIPYLAEAGAREISRSRPIECLVLRLDEVVFGRPFAPARSGRLAPCRRRRPRDRRCGHRRVT